LSDAADLKGHGHDVADVAEVTLRKRYPDLLDVVE